MLTWTRELDRRSRFRGQGPAVLALWREFAWKGARPDRKFELSEEEILKAEGVVRAGLRRLAIPTSE